MSSVVNTAERVGAAARGGGRRASMTSTRYWACLFVLGAAALGVWVLPARLGIFLQKEAVPLKKPLQLFDAKLLAPRYERHPATDQIPPMSEDMIASLGTKDFLQILLVDTQAPPDSAVRVAKVFLTYYTGRPDMVPHVPDECYLAGGFDPLGATTASVPVRGVGAPDDHIPVRVVEFRAPAGRRTASSGDTTAVMYFFHVNGGWATTRNGVRTMLSNPFERFAYYAKIEIYFSDYSLSRNADRQASLEALPPLLERLLPVLYEQHLNLDLFRGNGKPSAAADAGKR